MSCTRLSLAMILGVCLIGCTSKHAKRQRLIQELCAGQMVTFQAKAQEHWNFIDGLKNRSQDQQDLLITPVVSQDFDREFRLLQAKFEQVISSPKLSIQNRESLEKAFFKDLILLVTTHSDAQRFVDNCEALFTMILKKCEYRAGRLQSCLASNTDAIVELSRELPFYQTLKRIQLRR